MPTLFRKPVTERESAQSSSPIRRKTPSRPFRLQEALYQSKPLFIFACVAMVFLAGTLILALFEPGLEYRISKLPATDNSSDQFLRTLSALANAEVNRDTSVDVLTDGPQFYEAELAAIRSARKSVNLEAYIFEKGEITRRFVEALTERAQAGVKVNLVVDAIGALATDNQYFGGLTQAGGHVGWYHPIRWFTWQRVNNRTHRELLIVDGTVGFIGGAGFADHWYLDTREQPRWRDMMTRVRGQAVAHLQSTFAENWVEATGEILVGQQYFPFPPSDGKSVSLVVDSTPSTGRSSRARMLFQTLLSSAKRSIHITTPYFLPDESVRDELVAAIRERGVDVKVITPGAKSDHQLTRRSSRRLFGDILKAGGHIYEYQPAMTHTKSLVIDGLWVVLGSTNLDSRSFIHNDEVNIAIRDSDVAARVEQDFARDLSRSTEITYEKWKNRPFWELLEEGLGGLIERQQ